MNPHEVVKTLSRKHKRPPVPALMAAFFNPDDIASLMLAELKRLLAALNASLDAPTEAEHRALLKRAISAPSPVFYGFFLAATWKQKEAFRPFTELLSWPQAMLPNLLSEAVVTEDVASRILAEFYDGDPEPLYKLLTDPTGDDSIRFWQWRTLIRVATKGEIDHDALRSLLARAFDDLEEEPNRMVWSGWESVIIYFGFENLAPLVERAHAKKFIAQRNLDDFNREWAYARAHPECPFEGDPIEFGRGLAQEVEEAFASR
jgi:Protein of unknown function (DUF1186)